MRLGIVLPKVNPEAIVVPSSCIYAGCSGRKFHLRQQVAKPLCDTVYQEVPVHCYQCLKCKRTFRVYPEGTTRAQTTKLVDESVGPCCPTLKNSPTGRRAEAEAIYRRALLATSLSSHDYLLL